MKKTLVKILPALVFVIGTISLLGAGYWLYERLYGGEIVVGSQAPAKDAVELEGRWLLQQEGDSKPRVVFTAQDGYYEILYIPETVKAPVQFTRGTYEISPDGEITLKPRRDLGVPEFPAEREVTFLNFRSYKFPVSHNRGKKTMVWTGGQHQGHVNREHPLFLKINPENRKLIWQLAENK